MPSIRRERLLRENLDSKFVAVPVSGRRNSRYFEVINLEDRSDVVAQLKKTEVYKWLHNTYTE